jgi:hypothetical protein
MISDFKYALRTLAKTPGFTIIAVVTLALAIGANTAIFSLINDLFLRSLSFKEPRRVVHFLSNAWDRKLVDLPLSLPRFQHYRAGQTICEDLAAENVFAFTLTGLGDAVQLFGGRVTSNYFDVLGLRPIRGRNFLPNEEEGADVAMVTENFWQKRMGGDPNVIGRSITLDGVAHTEHAVCLGRSERRGLDNEAVRDSWFHVRADDAWHHLFARRRPLETGHVCRTSASRVGRARSKL